MRLKEVKFWRHVTLTASTVDLNLAHHGKVSALGFCKLLDFLIVPRFLLVELIAGEPQDDQSLLLILGIEFTQLL